MKTFKIKLPEVAGFKHKLDEEGCLVYRHAKVDEYIQGGSGMRGANRVSAPASSLRPYFILEKEERKFQFGDRVEIDAGIGFVTNLQGETLTVRRRYTYVGEIRHINNAQLLQESCPETVADTIQIINETVE